MDITKWISVPLELLLRLCDGLLNNQVLAIILFTLLTKVILLPVSLWVQKNSVAMVRLTPEMNRLKLQYYGDKDTIAEKTQALYKKERYSPLVSIVPMVLQLVLLIGVIGAVRGFLAGQETVLQQTPWKTGGLTWLMPVLAGLAALALGFAQNGINPLQREQSKLEQWMTNGFSIAISLSLGAFVPVGVGIYWVCSNLFSILQQLVLNLIINPKKHVDYAALEESRQELLQLSAAQASQSKEEGSEQPG